MTTFNFEKRQALLFKQDRLTDYHFDSRAKFRTLNRGIQYANGEFENGEDIAREVFTSLYQQDVETVEEPTQFFQKTMKALENIPAFQQLKNKTVGDK